MALPHQSIATISSPEFINLQPLDVNPFMSACEIKVLYLGENRNRSFISKEVAVEMSKTLRGAPIVGYFREENEDFTGHGEQVILDDDGIHFNVLTKPYGFVAPDAKVWFQKFQDTDEFGNAIERQYLMTTGYLWTGQFKESQIVIDEGKPQSMELDEQTLNGHWATNIKENMEFFIINDAIFTKLCILGDDTEPCFEGASVTKPDVSSRFSIDEEFKTTLFSMIKDLQNALKGGNEMAKEEKSKVAETEFEQQENTESSEPEVTTSFESSENPEAPDEGMETSFENHENENEEEEKPAESFKKEDEEDKDNEESDSEGEDTDKQDEDDDEKKKYSLLEQQYTDLQTQYNNLKADYDNLVEFKKNVENKEKDALIEKFYMLSEEDKKDVIENKEKYTLDEIEAKLAVIGYKKGVNFSSDTSDNNDNEVEEENVDPSLVTFSYQDESNLPDWVKVVKNREENI